MALEDSKYYQFYKKHQKFLHFIEGIFVILLLGLIWIKMAQHVTLEEQINQQCGWAEEDYQCYCEKGKVTELKNRALGNNFDLDLTNITITET